jgi:hypothetical protein
MMSFRERSTWYEAKIAASTARWETAPRIWQSHRADPHTSDADAQSRADMGVIAAALITMGVAFRHAVKHTHDAEIDSLLQIRLDTGQHGEAAGNVEPADHDRDTGGSSLAPRYKDQRPASC